MTLNENNEYRATQMPLPTGRATTEPVSLAGYRRGKEVSQGLGGLLSNTSEGEASNNTYSATTQGVSPHGNLDTPRRATVVNKRVTTKDILGSEAPDNEPNSGDSLMPNAGDELTDAKIAAAEARAERDLARLEGTLRQDFEGVRTDMATFRGEVLRAIADQGAAMATFRGDLVNAVAGQTAGIASFTGEIHNDLQAMRTDMSSFKGEVHNDLQAMRTDMASLKGDVGIQLAGMPTKADARSNMQWIIGTLAALIVAVAGLIVASFQTGLAVGVLPPKSPQLEAAPVVVPAPGAAAPVTPQANPAP
jgi:hypothetical protein